jgi:hypothetical protein
MLQALLERFEFFPVKCRVQRALEISQIELENEKAVAAVHFAFKTKAIPPYSTV